MIMPKLISLFAIAFFTSIVVNPGHAQVLLGVSANLLPKNPTSADNLKLSIPPSSDCYLYKANPYRVTMSQSNITVTMGEIGEPRICAPLLARPQREFDIGRLPAGNYTLTVTDAFVSGVPIMTLIDKAPFGVTDAREPKAAPYVRLDYSGHWWDPNDSGWGLFIWQDAKSPTDSMLAAWFSYTADGKPMWYVFQPKWQTSSATTEVALLQTSRPPGATSPPLGSTSNSSVGTASLDFTNFGMTDEGTLTYTFINGAKQVRKIQRFKP
jgi:hypothetical protein